MIPKDEWEWGGYPGHFIGAHDCRFRLNTRVGPWIVSTVGEYTPRLLSSEVRPLGGGTHDLYETMVFVAKREAGCGCWVQESGAERDCVRYATHEEAQSGHLAMCEKWAAVPLDDDAADREDCDRCAGSGLRETASSLRREDIPDECRECGGRGWV